MFRFSTNRLVIAFTSAFLAVVVVAAYATGYFACCDGITVIRVLDGTSGHKKFARGYQSEILTNIYKPMAYVESVITQTEVETVQSINGY